MRFDTKIGVVVRDDLAIWQRLNVVAFLAGGLAGGIPEVVGRPYEDGSGNAYLPMIRQPILVYEADSEALGRIRERALSRGLGLGIYTEDLFSTGNDDDNRAAVAVVAADKLNLAGVIVYGPRNPVDRTLKGLALHG